MVHAHDIRNIVDGFLGFFGAHGYVHHDAMPLIPVGDSTLSFTNATIVPIKRYVREPYVSPGFVLYQPCVRLRNVAQDTFDGPFTSFFRMVSIFSHPSIAVTDVQREISEYLEDILHIEPVDIVVHTNHASAHLLAYWKDRYTVVLGAHAPSFYEWQYGLPGTTGRGVTICVRTGTTWRELGNFVEVCTDGVCVGYEFGFGVESCLGIQHNLSDNFQVLFGSVTERKLSDLTCTYAVALQALVDHKGVVPGSTRSAFIRLERELVYTLYERTRGTTFQIASLDWDMCDVRPEIVARAEQRLRAKLSRVTKSVALLARYRAYVALMVSRGRSHAWAELKVKQYITKHGLQRIVRSQLSYTFL